MDDFPDTDIFALTLAQMQKDGTGSLADVLDGTFDTDVFTETANRVLGLGEVVFNARLEREGDTTWTLRYDFKPPFQIKTLPAGVFDDPQR